MFKVIGADQKEYGPISTVQVRQWITDRRLSGASLAQRATGGDWQPLSAFEEFADIFQPAGEAPAPEAASASQAAFAAAPMPTASREMALAAVKGPALALIIIAAIGLALSVLRGVAMLAGFAPTMSQEMPGMSPQWQQLMVANGAVGVLLILIGLALNCAILFGALKMRQLQSHTFAIVTCILAILPCTCCCIGLPFGIWGLVVLNKPEVKSQFTN